MKHSNTHNYYIMKRKRLLSKNLLYVGLITAVICLGIVDAQAAVEVESNLVYGSAVDYTGSNVVLTLDAYYENSSQTNRPVVILTHGGGFGGGDKGYTIWQGNFYPDAATAFATNGFVAFSINYRLKFADFTQQIDMAIEDVMMALDWIRANSAVYGIDATRVLIAGDSAGGGLAVNASYKSTNADSFLGCISIWGGIPPYGNDVHPVNIYPITVQTPPTCMIHGTVDTVVPYAISEILSSNLTAAAIYNELHPLEGYNHYPVMENGVYNTNLVRNIIDYMITFANLTTSNLTSATPVRLADYGLQVSNGLFSFYITGPTNMTVEIDQSTNQMETWQAISTNQLLTGTVWFTNDIPAVSKFYRVQIITP